MVANREGQVLRRKLLSGDVRRTIVTAPPALGAGVQVHDVLVGQIPEAVDTEGLFALDLAFEVVDLRKRVRTALVCKHVRNDREHVKVLGVRKDVEKDQDERRVPPETEVLDGSDRTGARPRQQLSDDSTEGLPPTGMDRIASGGRVESESASDVHEVGEHHGDDDEEDQDRLGEHVAADVMTDRHARLVLDLFRIATVFALLDPPQVEKRHGADDGGKSGHLLDERVELAEPVVLAQ